LFNVGANTCSRITPKGTPETADLGLPQ
jgi:hypothetical protein